MKVWSIILQSVGIVLIIIVVGWFLGFNPKPTQQTVIHLINNPSYDTINYEYQKQRCLLNIMLSESYSETVYKCPAGQPTIGFGHRMTKQDTFTKITFSQAYELMQADFDVCIGLAALGMGYEKDDNKQLAVAHALYGLGYGTVSKIKDFKKEILSYCYYKSKGHMKRSEYILKARKFELELWETK